MSKGLESLKVIKNELKFYYQDEWNITRYPKDIETIEKELTLLQDLLGHITDLYMKRELDYYADRDAFYYDYYIVFDNTPLKVSKDLYDDVRKQLDLPNKCVDW